jgi:hypothetical protein
MKLLRREKYLYLRGHNEIMQVTAASGKVTPYNLN